MERPLLGRGIGNCSIMTNSYISTFILGWMASVALALVGHLFWLQIREMRRNRRMDAERDRLGLRRG